MRGRLPRIPPRAAHVPELRFLFVTTFLQAPDGQSEFRLGPGSYLMQPGGNYRHTTGCDKVSECVFFVESDGAFDLHLAQ